MKKILIQILLLLLICTLSYANEPITFQSTATQNTLVELYTSEGCSSCPPAEAWLSGLKESPDLWENVVPIAFHVDYWDYLGWKDPFAQKKFTKRQRRYSKELRMRNVYTPGFFVNGEEWRGFFSGESLPKKKRNTAGILEVKTTDKQTFEIKFIPEGQSPGDAPLTAHIVLLGMNLKSDITSGENRGRNLTHDFVALEMKSVDLVEFESGTFVGKIDVESNDAKALAAWTTTESRSTPLQTVGGTL